MKIQDSIERNKSYAQTEFLMIQIKEYIKALNNGKKESCQINCKQPSSLDNSIFRLILNDIDRVKTENYCINVPIIKWAYPEENYIDIEQMICFLNNELIRLNSILKSSKNIDVEKFCDCFKANLMREFFDNR